MNRKTATGSQPLRQSNRVSSTSQGSKKSAYLYYTAIAVIVIVILFSQPWLVGGKPLNTRACSGHGYRNSSDKDNACVCDLQHYGNDCQYKYCPFGSSWLSPPIADHSRYSPDVPCSNMGICDPHTGLCACRDGYEGRACERLSCPRLGYSPWTADTNLLQGIKLFNHDARKSNVIIDRSGRIPACSGHGRCRTLLEAGREFNGLTLVRPSTQYSSWDADRIQGCLCDYGYEGYDCSKKSCPWGRDPLTSQYDTPERLILECQATNGYFSIKILGQFTYPLPYDADPALLKNALEEIAPVGEVDVRMDNSDGFPSVCGSFTTHRTSISFINPKTAVSPRIFLTRNTSKSLQWSDSDTALFLSYNSSYSALTPILRMVTEWKLSCPICPSCSGYVLFGYGRSLTSPIDITASGGASSIATELLTLSDLFDQGWTNVDINITTSSGEDVICSSTQSQMVTINIYSDYGNLPTADFIDSSYFDSSKSSTANITFSSNKGNATLYECSNQGYCDYISGTCQCLSYFSQDTKTRANQRKIYYTSSSDGQGNKGNRGDCGYVSLSIPSCYIDGRSICGHRGQCSNATNTCSCYDGWTGMTCEIRTCPKGPAFFDEPMTNSIAHQPAECSNNGHCIRNEGRCSCRTGFTGIACEIKDCDRDVSTGEACSGRGWCFNMNKYASLWGYTYGDQYDSEFHTYPSTWDAFNWFECVCAAKTSAGFDGNPKYPSVGPMASISGYAFQGKPLMGFSGYDCSQRNCPKGDDVSYRNNYGGNVEIQKVICRRDANSSAAFTLSIFGETSQPMYPSDGLTSIQSAIESTRSVGTVLISWVNNSITTACSTYYNESSGGFLVHFSSEFGDLDMMIVSNLTTSERISDDDAYTTITDIIIQEYAKGTNANLECGGPAMGMCDRQLGICRCIDYQGSSNGSNAPGSIGDCGYRMPYKVQSIKIDGDMD